MWCLLMEHHIPYIFLNLLFIYLQMKPLPFKKRKSTSSYEVSGGVFFFFFPQRAEQVIFAS